MARGEGRASQGLADLLPAKAKVVDSPHVRELDDLDVRIAPVFGHGRAPDFCHGS